VLWDGKVTASPLPDDAQTQNIMAFNDLVRDDERVENLLLPLRDGLMIIRKM
jgi:predicted O-methyltransferase YrrM